MVCLIVHFIPSSDILLLQFYNATNSTARSTLMKGVHAPEADALVDICTI